MPMSMMGGQMGMPMGMMPQQGMMGGQMGMPMGQGMMGMQGMPTMIQGPNGQTMMIMQMMPQQLQQMQQAAQQQQQSGNQGSTSGGQSQGSGQQNPQNSLQSMMQGMGMQGLPMGMMMPGMGGQMGGMQGMMLPQGMQMGMMGNPMGMMNPNGQGVNGQQGGNPIALGMGMPGGMGFMIPGQNMQQGQQNSNDLKNQDKSIANKASNDPSKKIESGKKDDKADIFPPPIGEGNAQKSNSMSIPSFLSPGQFPPTSIFQGQNKD